LGNPGKEGGSRTSSKEVKTGGLGDEGSEKVRLEEEKRNRAKQQARRKRNLPQLRGPKTEIK